MESAINISDEEITSIYQEIKITNNLPDANLKPQQVQAIKEILKKEHIFLNMTTGAGKTYTMLCYQLILSKVITFVYILLKGYCYILY